MDMDLPGLLGNPQFNQVFRNLQRACQKIFVDPSAANLDELNSVCSYFDPTLLGKFLRYVIIPLGAQLFRTEEISNNVIQCLIQLLERSIISDLNIFLNIYSLTLRQLQDADSPEAVREISEELKLAVLKCITQLVKSSTKDVRRGFLCRKYYSKLSTGVYLCAEIAKKEKYVAIKVEALNCLLFLTHVTNELTFDEEFKKDLANVLMLMVPGICGACLNIVSNGEIQNHKSIVLALRLWFRLIGTVLSVKLLEDTPTVFKLEESDDKKGDCDANKDHSKESNEEFLKTLSVTKLDKEWIKSTDKHLAHVTKIMVSCQNHSHWRVRLELCMASYHLLNTCALNIAESVGYLAETLTFLSQDENKSVADYSKRCLTHIGVKCNEMMDKRLVEVVEENFYVLLARLPRIFHGADITLKERQLTLICGFLDMLGPAHVPAVFRSSQHLKRFLHCLIICATPDYGDVNLMEEISLRELESNSYAGKPKWRQLKYCETIKCEECLSSVCSKLVEYSDLEMLINTLLDDFNAENEYQNNILILFILLFSSGSPDKFQNLSSLLKNVVLTLMEPSLWNIPVNVVNKSTSKSGIQRNIIQICLLTEAVGCISEATGPSVFLPLLLRCLYPILECAGSPLSLISTAGEASLQKLARLYPEGSVSTLISKNVDYLSHHVMLKLRQAHKNPRILSVLSIIMQHSSLDSLPSLHDIINDVLIQSCDMFQDINGSAFLHVFHTYLLCITKWTKTNEKYSFGTEMKAKSVVSELLEYKEALLAADPQQNDDEQSFEPDISQLVEEQQDRKKTEDEEVKLPDHVKLTQDILIRSLHFLPGYDLGRQLLVLEIMTEGVVILSHWPDVLLPVIHKIWSPFVERFKSSNNPILLHKAFQLLRIFARHSKDFIRTRTVNEVLPCLCKVLKDNGNGSKKKDPSDAHVFTQMYKLQLHLLGGLGHLAIDLDALPKQLYPLLDAATPYLSAKQPLSLQEQCFQLFKKIGDKHPDLVWLHLMSVYPVPLELKAPLDGLRDYKFEPQPQNKEEYSVAVGELLPAV